MIKHVFLVLVLFLSGCVFVQFSTNASLAQNGAYSYIYIYIYIDEPTGDFEFSKHGLFVGNVPERYRIIIPINDGDFKYTELVLEKSKRGKYFKIKNITGGTVSLHNCIAKIHLFVNEQAADFNGVYEFLNFECKKT